MIDRIVIDSGKRQFAKLNLVIEKFNYYRQLSSAGLHKLSSTDFLKLKYEFNQFLNINLGFFADTYPTKLFRVTNNKRITGKFQYKLQKISDIIGPPAGQSKLGRCNLAGESVFYSALDLMTAIWETQPEKEDVITVSEWRIKHGQRLNNHFIFHPEETNLSKESREAYKEYLKAKENLGPNYAKIFNEIMRFSAEEFMKPVDDDKRNNYLFSALISSRLLQEKPDKNGFKIESISYPSIKRDHEVTNMAILNSLVLQKLDLVDLTIYTIGETNYGPSNKKREDIIKVSELQTHHKSFDFEHDQIYWDLKRELNDAMELHKKYRQ
jgi:hypothetical protein